VEPAVSGRHAEPIVPDDVTGAELDRQVRGELGTLSKDNAAGVARHLVMVGRLLQEDPEGAYAHAMAAQRRAGRVAVVREAAGLAAYRCDKFDEALRELRTARRLTGSQEHLPIMADCERGLGRPERAIAMLSSPEAASLDRIGTLELLMVAAGARLDLGQSAAAVVMLEVPELTATVPPGTAATQARLQSAYSDALAAAGRRDEAHTWLLRVAATDTDGVTGAAERLGLDGDDIFDLLDDDEPSEAGGTAGTSAPTEAGSGAAEVGDAEVGDAEVGDAEVGDADRDAEGPVGAEAPDGDEQRA